MTQNGPVDNSALAVLDPFISVLLTLQLRNHTLGNRVWATFFTLTVSPVHVLMLSTQTVLFIQAVRGLHRLRASGIVPCIIFFSTQLSCLLMFIYLRFTLGRL